MRKRLALSVFSALILAVVAVGGNVTTAGASSVPQKYDLGACC